MSTKKKELTMESRMGELYTSPIGHNAIYKVLLQLNIPEKWIQSPIIANLKLNTIAALTEKKMGKGFFETLLNLINIEKDTPADGNGPITGKWWKEAVFY